MASSRSEGLEGEAVAFGHLGLKELLETRVSEGTDAGEDSVDLRADDSDGLAVVLTSEVGDVGSRATGGLCVVRVEADLREVRLLDGRAKRFGSVIG